MPDIKSVLFVCTGNSCRSVMAEGLLKKYLRQFGKGAIEVSSAGVMAPAGMPPTEETIAVMKREGVDISANRSRKLTPDLIARADLILVMEKIHKNEVLNLDPSASSKTYLLKEFGTEKRGDLNLNIKDPIGKPVGEYKMRLDEIKNEIERIVKLL